MEKQGRGFGGGDKRVGSRSDPVTVGYANGLIGYVPGKKTYALGGYEVASSYHLFLRPAPFTEEAEDLVVGKAVDLASVLSQK